MKCDIILAGVGGQGVLSLSAIIASSAMRDGLHVKQSEVHGMAQRGGAVLSNLRLSDKEIESDLIPKGTASMILAMEPLEGLRYLAYLGREGKLITSSDPFLNIPDYPDLSTLLSRIKELPGAVVVEAKALAEKAGSSRATNTVMLGASSCLLPIREDTLRLVIRELFGPKGEKVVEMNLKAFDMGREVSG